MNIYLSITTLSPTYLNTAMNLSQLVPIITFVINKSIRSYILKFGFNKKSNIVFSIILYIWNLYPQIISLSLPLLSFNELMCQKKHLVQLNNVSLLFDFFNGNKLLLYAADNFSILSLQSQFLHIQLFSYYKFYWLSYVYKCDTNWFHCFKLSHNFPAYES